MQDSWPASAVANRMQTETAKVAMLEQLKAHTSTSVPKVTQDAHIMGTDLRSLKHASEEHTSSHRNKLEEFYPLRELLMRCGQPRA